MIPDNDLKPIGEAMSALRRALTSAILERLDDDESIALLSDVRRQVSAAQNKLQVQQRRES